MFPTTFDELNKLVGYKRSMSVDQYFDEMHLTKQQKEQRKKLARDLEDELVWTMAYMFYAKQQGLPVSMDAVQELRQRYLEAVGNTVVIDAYIQSHIAITAINIVDATNRHMDDPYYYSEDRARLIAENEASSIFNYTEYEDASKNMKYKTWHTIMDNHERESHAEINGATIGINEWFQLQGGECQFPRQDTLPDEEAVNCRCSLSFS